MLTSIRKSIPDGMGNHLVVALAFCDNHYKHNALSIPEEFDYIEIADISIFKLNERQKIHPVAFFRMARWLIEQLNSFDNVIFTYICSYENLETRHSEIPPQEYRKRLFKLLYDRYKDQIQEYEKQDITVDLPALRTYACAFYRPKYSPIIHITTAHIANKYT